MNENPINLSEIRLRNLANFLSKYSLLNKEGQEIIRGMVNDLCAQEQDEIEACAKDEKIIDLLNDF